MNPDTVFELRDYTLHPGQRDVLIELFEANFIESQNVLGAHVRGIFRDIDRPDHFVWLRSFASMEARLSALQSFYSGPLWQAHRDAANATMIDSDDVHLLRPVGPPMPGSAAIDGALFIVDVLPDVPEKKLASSLETRRDVVAVFRTEPSENNFPRLPVHADKVAVVLRAAATYGQPEQLRELPAPLRTLRLRPTMRSPLQLASPVPSPQDFDFLQGEWKVRNRRLKARHAGSSDWDEFSSTSRFWTLLDGVANVDEFDCSSRDFKGMSIRALDQLTGVWSIYWINSKRGTLLPPVRGGFVGDNGEFIGEDVDGAQPILCRFNWKRDRNAPRWEQAFSIDGGANWEINWVMDFERK